MSRVAMACHRSVLVKFGLSRGISCSLGISVIFKGYSSRYLHVFIPASTSVEGTGNLMCDPKLTNQRLDWLFDASMYNGVHYIRAITYNIQYLGIYSIYM